MVVLYNKSTKKWRFFYLHILTLCAIMALVRTRKKQEVINRDGRRAYRWACQERKGIIMLRGFVKCISRKERIAYMMDNRFGNWSDSELESVMKIVGVKDDYSNASKEEKIKAIVATLKMAKDDKAQFDRVNDNGEKVDDMDAMKSSVQYTRLVTNLYAKSNQLV